MNDEGPRSKNV